MGFRSPLLFQIMIIQKNMNYDNMIGQNERGYLKRQNVQTPKCGCGNRNSTRCVAVADAVAVSVAVCFKTATSEFLFFVFIQNTKF